uniref:Uncharacterized protein n=1 Tax=Lepeophtheirus salmonis TaxID=72036 RepID=A0A0K2U4X9_LEPSM
MIPQIVPTDDYLIKLRFKGAQLKCQNCFSFEHNKLSCENERINAQEHVKSLKTSLVSMNISDNITLEDSSNMMDKSNQNKNKKIARFESQVY